MSKEAMKSGEGASATVTITLPAPAQQEPVAMHEDWYDSNSCGHCGMVGGHAKTCRHYTSPPPQRKPLTSEEVAALRFKHGITSHGRGIKEFTQIVDFVRDIEAAHNIKEQP